VAAALGELHAGTPDVDSRLLSRAALAAELGVSVATITRWRAEGLPSIAVGSTPRYRLAAIHAWLDSRTTASTPRTDDPPRTPPVMALAGCMRRAGGGR
jgi:predicted DNA-binding transcriptional regulator AlpA